MNCVKEVNHPSEEGSPRPHHLACVVEQADQGLQLLAGAGPAITPLSQEILKALEFLLRQPELPSNRVDFHTKEYQASGRAFPFLDLHGHAEYLADTVEDLQAQLALWRIRQSNDDKII